MSEHLAMPLQFALKLCRPNRAGLLGFAGIVAAFALGVVVASPLPAGDGQFVVMLLVGLPGCYGVYRLVRKVAVREALVTVEPRQLSITYPTTGQQVQIPFAEVVSYRDEVLRDGRELRFRLRSGERVRLVTNNFLGAAGDYDGLLRAVEAAMASYQNEAATADTVETTGIMREKSFYKKPIATTLLVVAGMLIVWMIVDALVRGKPLNGTILVEIGVVLGYAGLWYAARQRRAK